MDKCLQPSEFEAYCRGELKSARRARVVQHLQSCTACRCTYEELCSGTLFMAENASLLCSIMDTDQTHSSAEPQAATHVHLPRVDGYEVLRLIGRGGMGAVYEAVQLKLSRKVALKLLPAVAGSAQPSLVTRFKREATAAAKLHHTNIVPIYDFGESRDGYYYAMELIHGLSLRELIRRLAAANASEISATMLAAMVQDSALSPVALSGGEGAIPANAGSVLSGGSGSGLGRNRSYYRQIARWIADVAGALHYAHLCGVIHRDIKPGNLILCTDGRIMVADFGLAKTSSDESITLSGSLLGTYRYMSPEQIGAKRLRIDARTDVYSLGVTLYELLTLQPAFAATEREELLGQIMFREPTALRRIVPGVPAELQTICHKAMEKSPEARYGSANDLADDLLRYIDDLPIVARPTGPVGRAQKFVRRHRAATVVGGLMLVCAATTAGLLHSRSVARQEASEARSGRLRELLNRGVTAGKADQYAEAVSAYTQYLVEQPGDLPVMFELARAEKELYYRSHDLVHVERSERTIDQALAVTNNRYQFHFLNLKGALRRIQGDYVAAADLAKDAIALDGTSYAPWCNLGYAYILMGRFDDAETAWQNSMDKIGESHAPMTWCNLGALRIYRNDPAAADALAPSYDADPKNVYTLLHMARLHLEVDALRDPKKALQYAHAAKVLFGTSEDPDFSGRVRRVAALAELASENYSDAVEDAQRALSVDDDPPAFAHGILAAAYARQGSPKESAIELAELERSWPPQLRQQGYAADQVFGRYIWIDSNRVLEQLRDIAQPRRSRINPPPSITGLP